MTPSTISILEPDTDVVDRSRADLSVATAVELPERLKDGTGEPSGLDHVLVLTAQADRVKLRGPVQRA